MVSQEIINNLLKEQYIYNLGNHYLITPNFEINYYLGVVLGVCFLDTFFDILFWPHIKPLRDKLREKIKCWIKTKILNFGKRQQ